MSTCCHKYWHTYQKKSKRCHEAFFCEFPRATILFLVDLLKAAEVYIKDSSVDDAESNGTNKFYIFSHFLRNIEYKGARV